MPSGAYVVDLSPEQSVTGAQVRRSVPLPPAGNSGTIDFDDVFLSFSAQPPIEITVRIFGQGTAQLFSNTFDVQRGRTGVGRVIQVGDEAAQITFTPRAGTAQALSAFVEYSTP